LIVSAIAVIASGRRMRSNSSKITISDAARDISCRVRRTPSGVSELTSTSDGGAASGFRNPWNPMLGWRFAASISLNAIAQRDGYVSEMSQFVRDTTKDCRLARKAEIMLDRDVFPVPRSP